MRADSCSGPTTDSICGHGLGRMGHSSNFARWPHLGPIPPMDGGGHLVPLSYVYGYRGGVGRIGVAQDTIGDNGLEIRARVRRYQLILSRCAAGFVPKSAISEISRSGQRKNGRSGGNFLSAKRRAGARAPTPLLGIAGVLYFAPRRICYTSISPIGKYSSSPATRRRTARRRAYMAVYWRLPAGGLAATRWDRATHKPATGGTPRS